MAYGYREQRLLTDDQHREEKTDAPGNEQQRQVHQGPLLITANDSFNGLLDIS